MASKFMGKEDFDYSKIVNYKDFLDPFTILAMTKFAPTLNNPKERVLEESLGETAQVFDLKEGQDHYLAFNAEILGTKVAVAVEMSRRDPKNMLRYFSTTGIDTANMSLNDLLGVGARPSAYQLIMCFGDDEFISDPEKNEALLEGYRIAADENKVAITGGETGMVKGIVVPGMADLMGASFGMISPKSRFCHGARVQPGNILYGLLTPGVNANGISLIRKIADHSRLGYFQELPSGITFGEAVLKPTPSYSPAVQAMFDAGVPITYLQPITGHGFKKIARARKDLTYIITKLPERPEVFDYIHKRSNNSDKQMLENYNNGVGFVVYTSRKDSRIPEIAKQNGSEAMELGYVDEGPRRVKVRTDRFNVTFWKRDIVGKAA
ncbi:MAG: AIR synthase related protein [archaeon]